MTEQTNNTSYKNTGRSKRFYIISRVIAVILLAGGAFFLLIGVVSLLMALFGTRIEGTIVVQDCRHSYGRGTTTPYECRGTFTPNDSSLPPKYFESDAGGGIRTGKNLTPGVTYSGYAVADADGTSLSDGAQVVIDGDGQSKQSAYWTTGIFAFLGATLAWGGVAAWRLTTKKSRAKDIAQHATWQKEHAASNFDIPADINATLKDSSQKLSVAATKVTGFLDSAVHGGGTLTMQGDSIDYKPKSKKVAPVHIAINTISRINVRKQRLEIYLNSSEHYTFLITLPSGYTYTYAGDGSAFGLVLTAIDIASNMGATIDQAKSYHTTRDAWDPWVAHITQLQPNTIVEHKSRAWRSVAGVLLVALIPVAILVVIVLAVQSGA